MSLKFIIKTLKGKINILYWFFYNYLCSKKLSIVQESTIDRFKFSSLHLRDIFKLQREYRNAFGHKMAFSLFVLLLVNRRKTSYVLYKGRKIVACNFYYFHRYEFVRGYIHRAFIFVSPKYQGLGVGNKIEREVISALRKQSVIHGIYSRVARDNISSLLLHKRSQFEVCDQYFDNGCEWYYMLLKFYDD